MAPGESDSTIFLSPHHDDAVLSCGGLVARLVDAGQKPLVVTVFGCEVLEEMVGDFAAWKHRRWGLRSGERVMEVRRQEDSAAASILGCDTRWLGLPDAIYRGDRYGSDQALFGVVKPQELWLASHLADEVVHLPEWRRGTRLYVPLGAGGHVDHQLVFAAGRILAERGQAVFAYEDCPYAIHTPASVTSRLDEIAGDVSAPTIVPIAATMQRRIDAISCYTTQIPVLFRFTSDFAAAVAEHAVVIGGAAGPAERYWPLSPGGRVRWSCE